MGFSAQFIGGPLDGVRSDVTNPPLAQPVLWGLRCLGRSCKLARALGAQGHDEMAPAARDECRVQRCHLFTADPVPHGLPVATEYRRTGARKNVHVYELKGDDPGGPAIFDRRVRRPSRVVLPT